MTYQHRISKRAKRIILKIDTNGQIVVTSPKHTPKKLIEELIQENQNWIKQQQTKRAKYSFITNNQVKIFGKNYQKKIIETDKISTIIKDKNILIQVLVKDKSKINKQLNRFLRNTATKYIIPRTHQLAENMDLKFKRITIREQTTRWGSCSSKKNLNFNWRLVHFAPEIIDYVIIHELSHLKHLNHSSRFWQLVAKFDPAYPVHRGILKRYSCC